jgi:hypothetical protein
MVFLERRIEKLISFRNVLPVGNIILCVYQVANIPLLSLGPIDLLFKGFRGTLQQILFFVFLFSTLLGNPKKYVNAIIIQQFFGGDWSTDRKFLEQKCKKAKKFSKIIFCLLVLSKTTMIKNY